MEVLVTERLILRPISRQHCTFQYVTWLNDERVYKFLDTRGGYSLEMLQKYIEKVIANDVLMWAIHLLENDKHIGNIKIDPINNELKTGEYGILMGERSEWGKGYAKEASEAVINYCFEEIGLRKISLGVVTDNEKAIRLYLGLGFQNERILPSKVIYDGISYDVLRMCKVNPKKV